MARWCTLAEKRLDYLTELFETGRWRRFHSERAFLENIQEAKVAVETWRDLMAREASPEHFAIDITGRNLKPATLPRHDEILVPVQQLEPEADAAEPARDIADDFLIALESQLLGSHEALSVTDAPDLDDVTLPRLDLDAMQQRYPLLRNAL